MTDDWHKPRGRGVHLTTAEIAKIRVAFNVGRKPRDIARELKCSSRIAAKYYGVFRGGRYRVPDMVQREPAVVRARFYKSNFEL